MALLTAQVVDLDGTAVTFAACAGGGDTVRWTNDLVIRVRNADASPHTVTIDCPATCSFGLAANAAHDLAVVVAAGAEQDIFVGQEKFKLAADGLVYITYTAVTSMTVAATR
jgi:hypothetical protein